MSMECKLRNLNTAIEAALVGIMGNNADVKTYGLAEPVLVRDTDTEQTIPAIVNNAGECINVFGECDLHDVVIYHRLMSKSYEAKSGYGSRPAYNEVCEMSLIVYGKRQAVNQYNLEKDICRAIIDATDRSIGSTDFNAIQVFATEYAGMPFILNPDYFLFKTNYRITSTLNKCNN